MSKKMWNKIFKSKTNKNSKALQAANKINKRNSIYEEYQQLNAALDIVPISEKFKYNSNTTTISAASNDASKSKQTTKIPQSSAATTTFSRVVNTLTLKRSQSSNQAKDVKNSTGNGNEGKEKNSKKSELEITAKSTTSLPDKAINKIYTNSSRECNNNNSTLNDNGNINSTNVTFDQCSKNNGNFNTSCNASLNQPQLTENEIVTATAASLNTKLNNNINNNEYLACKQNITNPSLQQQNRLSKIVIVVKKLEAGATTTTKASTAAATTPTASSITVSELATNLNNQISTINRTNNSSTNNHFYNNENGSLKSNHTNTALETSFALTPATETSAKPSSSAINNENQLSLHSCNDVHKTRSDNHYCTIYPKNENNDHLHPHNEDRILCSDKLDNDNSITTPTEVPETNASVQLAPCPICSRTFNPVTLRKHVGICEKMATKKRNKFDSSRQRREGTDLASYPLPKNFGLPEKATSNTSIIHAKNDRGQSPKPPIQQVSSPILTRKKASEDLSRSTVRSSMRKAVAANNTPTPAAPAATSTPTSNFNRDRMRSSERSLTRRGIQPPPAEQCPHCERCFGIKAYDRHVEWCKEKALLASIKHGSTKNEGSVAKARLEARIKYRAPCLKTKRSMNREKYSGLAGEEPEAEDATKCSKTSLNKTQDNSLMSMSMTSSVCSERRVTNSSTGNINEPVAIKKQKNNVSVGNHKSTRDDRNQIQRTPTKTATASATDEMQSEESIINLEFEMPEFYLMDEQMTEATAINKNQRATTAKMREVTVTAAKIKPQIKQQQRYQLQQQLKEQENDLEFNSKKSYHKRVTRDVQMLEENKSGSDLSLESILRDKRLHQTHKAFQIDGDYREDRKYHYENVVPTTDDMQYEAKEVPMENVDFGKNLNYYGSFKSNKENEKILQKLSAENVNSKMSINEYFENQELNECNMNFPTSSNTFENFCNDSNIVLDPEKFISDTTKAHSGSHTLPNLSSQNDPAHDPRYTRQGKYKELIRKHSHDNFRMDYDSEEPEVEDMSKCPPKLKSKERSQSKSLRRQMLNTELKEVEANKCGNFIATENEENVPLTTKCTRLDLVKTSQDSHSDLEIYKDCFTDSDELRRRKLASNDELKAQEYAKMATAREFRDDQQFGNNLETLKGASKSETFIPDLSKKSYRPLQCQDHFEKVSHSTENLNHNSSRIKSKDKIKTTSQRNDTPRTSPRLSGTSPQLSTFTPRSTQNETFRPMSLKICQPKRKKVLRQTVSCTNTFPMKAIMLPLSMEKHEICATSSAPQIKSDSKNGNKKKQIEYKKQKRHDMEVGDMKHNTCAVDEAIKVIKEPPQLKRGRSFTVSGLPDNYDPFLSAKRQLEELCSPSADTIDMPTTPSTPKLPSMPATPSSNSKMSTSLILSSSTPNTTPNLMTTSQIPQQTQKTPTLARSSSFRRTSSLRGPRRSPMLSARPPLFAQKHRPTIQRGLSDEGPISTNFLKPEEYDEMPVRSVCVNDFAINKSPRIVRRDTSVSNRKQPLKLNISAANGNSSSNTASPNVLQSKVVNNNSASKYVLKTDSLAVFLKFEHELEKLNTAATDDEHKKENILETPPSTASTLSTPMSNLDGPLNAKELKDKSNNLSKQNSAKNIKADILATIEGGDSYGNNSNDNSTNDLETTGKYGQIRLAPLNTKPTTPSTKPPSTPPMPRPSTPQSTTLSVKNSLAQNVEQNTHRSSKPVVLSSLFGGENKSTKQASLLYSEHKENSIGTADYIDPKLINKWDNLPININLKRTDFKHSDSDASEPRLEQSSSSSSESSAPAKKATTQTQQTKFLPTVKQQQTLQQQQQYEQHEQQNNLNQSHTPLHQPPLPITHNQRNSAEGRNLLKRRMRLGRNQFLYDASPEGDSCSADDEGANRSSMEGDAAQQHYNSMREREKAFERLSSIQINTMDAPFIPPLPAFDDFDFEEFLSSFQNDEEQFPIFKDCREFLMNRTSKKQRSMLMPNSAIQNTQNTNNANTQQSMNFKKSPSPQTLPPLTPQSHSNAGQHFQFPPLSQRPKNLFNSFSLNTRAKNKYDELGASKSTDTFCINSHTEEYKDLDSQSLNQKREIFISIETEQNDLDKSSISPNSIRNMVGNPQTVVEVEVDAAHDNKFSKISDDDDAEVSQNNSRCKNYAGHEHSPNVHLNNAKNLMQKMQEDFCQRGEEFSGKQKLAADQRTAPVDVNMNTNSTISRNARNIGKQNRTGGTPSGDAYGDSDELSSLDGYPLSSPNSRLGVSSKTSADSAYGSLSRQRSSELTSQRSSSRSRGMTSNLANTLLNRPLTEETCLGRSRQLSASSSSSSEHALPPITTSSSTSYHKQQQQHLHQQQIIYNSNNNNNNCNDLDDVMRYEMNNNNSNHPNLTCATDSHSNLESLHQYTSNSTMSSSMKMSKFCHECGSRFLLDQAKFCMDCGVKRIVL